MPARLNNIHANARGFTLVELSIVMAIVAVLSAIAIPRYANAQTRYQADAAAMRIRNDLELARRSAMQSSQSRQLLISTALDHYYLIDVKDLDDGSDNYAVDLSQSPYDADVVSAFGTTQSFSGRSYLAVTFDGFGQADASGSIVIAVGDQQRTISLDADTGKVEVR